MTPDDKAMAVLLVFLLAGCFSLFEYIVKDTIIEGRWHPVLVAPWMLIAWLVYTIFIWSLPNA